MVILDLACGLKKHEGAIGVDKYQLEGVDVVHDLLQFPWPFEDNYADTVLCSHFFEHIPGKLRPAFMEELYRIMKPGAMAMIAVPPYNSERAYQDYMHEWPPIAPSSMHYFNKDWRIKNDLTYGEYDLKCDFEVQAGANMDTDWKKRVKDVQIWSARHYLNTCTDLIFNLTKKE